MEEFAKLDSLHKILNPPKKPTVVRVGGSDKKFADQVKEEATRRQYEIETGRKWSDDPKAYDTWFGERTERRSGRTARSKAKEVAEAKKAIVRAKDDAYDAMIDFEKFPLAKDYRIVKSSTAQLRGLVNNAKKALDEKDPGQAAASSIAVLFTFIRNLDNSVVRASEIDAFNKMVPYEGQFKQMLQSVTKGGLTKEKLDGIMNTVLAKLAAQRGAYNSYAAQYQNRLRGIYKDTWEPAYYKAVAPLDSDIQQEYKSVSTPKKNKVLDDLKNKYKVGQ